MGNKTGEAGGKSGSCGFADYLSGFRGAVDTYGEISRTVQGLDAKWRETALRPIRDIQECVKGLEALQQQQKEWQDILGLRNWNDKVPRLYDFTKTGRNFVNTQSAPLSAVAIDQYKDSLDGVEKEAARTEEPKDSGDDAAFLTMTRTLQQAITEMFGRLIEKETALNSIIVEKQTAQIAELDKVVKGIGGLATASQNNFDASKIQGERSNRIAGTALVVSILAIVASACLVVHYGRVAHQDAETSGVALTNSLSGLTSAITNRIEGGWARFSKEESRKIAEELDRISAEINGLRPVEKKHWWLW